ASIRWAARGPSIAAAATFVPPTSTPMMGWRVRSLTVPLFAGPPAEGNPGGGRSVTRRTVSGSNLLETCPHGPSTGPEEHPHRAHRGRDLVHRLRRRLPRGSRLHLLDDVRERDERRHGRPAAPADRGGPPPRSVLPAGGRRLQHDVRADRPREP